MAVAPRLDNVLKRAEELERMDKKVEALDFVYETLVSKRARSLQLVQLEPLFAKFIVLAVELRRGKYVKDGLHQYKKLVLATGPDGVSALVRAVDLLLAMSEDAVAKAQQQAEEVQVDDLEEENPHDLLLAMVSSEEAKDRTDREVVTPWLKLLWENYRSVLDVLRNHSQLEEAYASVASQAFRFCLKFNRKIEFRRLAELIRTHLQYAATQSKHYHADLAAAKAEAIEHAGSKDITWEQIGAHMPPTAAQHPIDLSDANTLQRFLDTRFEQLQVAVELELWQEAFRSVEDVHSLFTVTHRGCPVSSIASYYRTLAQVFAVSNNYLFHAAAWFRYFSLLSSHKGAAADRRAVASFCILSVLCIPRAAAAGPVSARERRWMALINLQRCPTRESLLQAVVSKNVLEHAAPELRALFSLLVQDFEPLTLKSDLEELVPALKTNPEFGSYAEQLAEVVASSIFEDLAVSYSETRLDFVLDLASLPEPFQLPRPQLERLLVKGSVDRYHVRIDHAKRTVRFVDSLAYPLEGTAGAGVRAQLFELARTLRGVPGGFVKSRAGPSVDELDENPFEAENAAFLQRRVRETELFEQRKAEKQREEEERARAARAEAERAKTEAAERAQAEEQKREQQQYNKELEEIRRADKRRLAETINSMGYVQIDLDDLDNIDFQKLEEMQIDQVGRESQQLSARMAAVARRYDHLERALRQEEAKFWEADAQEQTVRDKLNHERRAEALRAGARTTHDVTQAYIKRVARVRPHYERFMGARQAAHDAAVAKKREENAKLFAEAKAKRIAEHEAKVKADAERAALEAKAEEERRKAEEARLEGVRRAREELEQRRAKEQAAAAEAGVPQPAASAEQAARLAARSPAAQTAAADVSAQGVRSSVFGAAKPVAVSPGAAGPARSSVFGSAVPGEPASGGAARRTGSYVPPALRAGASTGASPAATPSPRATASPFGNATPVQSTPSPAPQLRATPAQPQPGAAKASPFGNARPTAAPGGASRPVPRSAPAAAPQSAPAKANPFGRATAGAPAGGASASAPGTEPGTAPAPAPDAPKKYVPSFRRKK